MDCYEEVGMAVGDVLLGRATLNKLSDDLLARCWAATCGMFAAEAQRREGIGRPDRAPRGGVGADPRRLGSFRTETFFTGGRECSRFTAVTR